MVGTELFRFKRETRVFMSGLFEIRGIDRFVRPDFFVGVNGRFLCPAAKLFFRFRGFVLFPLIHLNAAFQTDRGRTDFEQRIRQNIFRIRFRGHMNELALVCGVHFVRLNGNDGSRTGLQRFCALHRAPLVPEKQWKRNQKQEKPSSNSLE